MTLNSGLQLFGRLWSGTDRDSAELRARHARVMLALTPWMMGVSLLNAGATVLALHGSVDPTPLLVWAALMAVLCAWGIRGWRRSRQRVAPGMPFKLVHRATWHAALYGLLWAVPPVLWFDGVQPPAQLLLATLITGTLAVGSFALAALPSAAMAFLWVLAAGAAVTLLRSDMPLHYPVLALLACYTVALSLVAYHLARVMAARHLSEREAARSDEVVGLLLRDFEDAAADVLWEVDAQGRFVHPSRRLVELLGHGAERLLPLGLQAAVESLQAEGSRGAERLFQAFERGEAFRDQVVRVQVDQGVRWWSVTAKPLLDADGRPSGWRGVIADVTAERQSHQHLSYLAHFDSLTGLANRVSLRHRLTQMIEQSQLPSGRRGALMCLDLDNFKTINDTLGHAVGDAVLQEMATRLRQHMRKSDLCGRLGGDEFAVVLDDVRSDEEAHQLAQRLVTALQAPMEVAGLTVRAGASIGLTFLPDHANTVDEAMSAADLALYAAKGAGRGRVHLFTVELGADRRRRWDLERELREALVRNELRVVYQPQVDVRSWDVVGVEALVRWVHPKLGAVMPSEFIAVAEEAGLIHDIGAWVIDRACHDAQQWLKPLRVAVNVSVSQAQHPSLVDVLRSSIQRHRVAPERLEVEVTESLLAGHTHAALQCLHGIKQLGVRVALDDFGTGYSSLAYLRLFPFDKLKIDRSYIRELKQTQEARAIVRTMLELAHVLGMDTLAEGVEETGQFEALRRVGCETIQGHFVAHPMPAPDVADWLERWREQPRPSMQVSPF